MKKIITLVFTVLLSLLISQQTFAHQEALDKSVVYYHSQDDTGYYFIEYKNIENKQTASKVFIDKKTFKDKMPFQFKKGDTLTVYFDQWEIIDID